MSTINNLTMPSLGEEYNLFLESWLVKTGDFINIDDNILEIKNKNIFVELFSPFKGKITILKQKGEEVKVGDILCTIEES